MKLQNHNYWIMIMLLCMMILSSCEKEEETGIHIEAFLYSLETNIEDPGTECELFGFIISVPESENQSKAHDHFQHSENSYFEIGLHDTYIFSKTPVSAKTWKNLQESESILIRIDLSEDDVDLIDSDDVFEVQTFKVTVSDLLSEIDQSATGYTERSGLTVYSGTESITVAFRFSTQ